MTDTHTAPRPATQARVASMTPEKPAQLGAFATYGTPFLAINHYNTDRDEELMRYIIAGVDIKHREGHPNVHPITRVEFFQNPEEELRGAVLFDNRGTALFHVVHALLGYGGSGPLLSRAICDELGIPSELFNEINTSLWGQNRYMVVISREQITELKGVMVALPHGTPGEWRKL